MTTYLAAPATCSSCDYSTRDLALLANHSCDVAMNGGSCEDFPCCGHQYGDCNGLKYGSDEAIRQSFLGHAYCDHEAGIFECEDYDECDDEDCEATGECICF